MKVSYQTRQAIRDHHQKSRRNEIKMEPKRLSERRPHRGRENHAGSSTWSREPGWDSPGPLAQLPGFRGRSRALQAAAGPGFVALLARQPFLSLENPSRNTF